MAAGHIRVTPELNEQLKALTQITKRSVQKEGEVALEQYLQSRVADVEAGRKSLKKQKK